MKIKYALAGMLAVAAGTLAACTTTDPAPTGAPAAQASAAAEKFFGPAGYGKLTLVMTEQEALATGDLQAKPVSALAGKHVYSFPDGPKPDPKRMKADEKIAAAAKAAEKSTDNSAAGSARDAKAYADETQRIVDRMVAYLDAGGAEFIDGKVTSLAAPADAKTPEGIKRGSTEAELKSAYAAKGLTKDNRIPVAGHPGWTMLFELEKGVVKYMSLNKAA